MCEPDRRCDRPSCPCNKPDTDLKDALERMKERFPTASGWSVDVYKNITGTAWIAIAEFGEVQIYVYGETPHAAVDAAIKAHDDMVKADALFQVLKAECEADRAMSDCVDRADWTLGVLIEYRRNRDAARAATDKSGALR